MNWKTILLTKTLIHWVTMTTGNRLLITSKFIKVYALMYINKRSQIAHDKQSKWELMYSPGVGDGVGVFSWQFHCSGKWLIYWSYFLELAFYTKLYYILKNSSSIVNPAFWPCSPITELPTKWKPFNKTITMHFAFVALLQSCFVINIIVIVQNNDCYDGNNYCIEIEKAIKALGSTRME